MSSPNQTPSTNEEAKISSASAPAPFNNAPSTSDPSNSTSTTIPSSVDASPSNPQATIPASSPNAEPASQQRNPSPLNPEHPITTQEDFDKWLNAVRESRKSFNEGAEDDEKKGEDNKKGGL